MFGSPRVPAIEAAKIPDDAVLLDVREPDEWAAGHAPAAVHVPLGELAARLADIPDTGEQQLYVVCRSGGRSARATEALGDAGYPAVNVTGGMRAWALAGKPMSSEGGARPEVI